MREIVGVDPALNQRWSTRRVLIKDRQGELAARFQRDHGRPPTPVEALQLAQQATLETRDAKHEPRTLAEQRATWHAQAAETLGGPDAVQAMISRTLNPISMTSPRRGCGVGGGDRGEGVGGGGGTAFDLAELACPRRSTTPRPGRTGSHRQSRSAGRAARRRGAAHPIDLLDSPRRRHQRAGRLRRADGSSVYTVAGSELFTSARILAAEQRLVATAGRTDGRVVDAATVELALLESAANGNALDAGQAALVRAMCTSGARLQLAIAPAGAGKTTAMRTLARAWSDSGGHVVGLAPSAAAAAQLRDATGVPAETLAKLTWSIHHGDLPDWADRIGRSTW